MLWIQGFHVIFVVCWFAGIFYLPRILVYYAQSSEPDTKAVLAVMARKLYRFVTPFMLLAMTAVAGRSPRWKLADRLLLLTLVSGFLQCLWLPGF